MATPAAFTLRKTARHSLPAAAGVMLAALGLTGCAAPLPTYPSGLSDAESLGIIADRLHAVRTVSAEADLTLTSGDSRTVRLDGAFVAAAPDRARLRAWKFGNPLFDITVNGENVWFFAAEHETATLSATSPAAPAAGADDLSRAPAAAVARSLALVNGDYFRAAAAVPGESTAGVLVVTAAIGGQPVRCEIDRPTLTPRRFVAPAGADRGELTLDRYAMIGGTPWPHRLRFIGPGGEIVIRLSGVELNGDVPAAAFVPPARAARLP